MSHTEVVNRLPFPAGVLHLMDSDGAPVAVAVLKATFDIGDDGLHLAEQQQPLLPAGKPYGEPGTSSFQYEPECAYYKPATDVVLVGAAVPPSGPAERVNVEFSVGALRKSAVVFGDRYWVRSYAGPYLTSPEPFESMPLVYERAFGGWDRSDLAPERHSFEPRNPVGKGFARRFAPGEDRLALPNIEDPRDLISDMRSRPKPVGFGFVNPDWQPRAALAGSFDESWTRDRAPLPPADFDRRFFNGASEGLMAEARLRGDETVELRNCSARPYMTFSLPGGPPPLCRFKVEGRPKEVVATELDTVVINTLENLAILTWRCHVHLPRGPESLLELRIKGGN
jgi:hypothetical protein